MSILIAVPDLDKIGGISYYYKSIRGKIKANVEYFYIGSRSNSYNLANELRRLLGDYYYFTSKIKKKEVDLVHLNTSLCIKSIIRDAVFVFLTKLYCKKNILYIFGWNDNFIKKYERFIKLLFKSLFFRSELIIVQSKEHIRKLKYWGYKKNIFLETGLVNNDEIIDTYSIFFDHDINNKIKLLFMSRIEKDKGIYETIQTYSILKKKYPQIELNIAGDGSEYKVIEKVIKNKGDNDIKILGWVSGVSKAKLLTESDIYILPTHHGEGIPSSILEAMAYGLPVITRSVGGIKDFFLKGKMGYVTASSDPSELAELIEILIKDRKLCREISHYNKKFATEHFIASKVANRIDKIYNQLLNETNC